MSGEQRMSDDLMAIADHTLKQIKGMTKEQAREYICSTVDEAEVVVAIWRKDDGALHFERIKGAWLTGARPSIAFYVDDRTKAERLRLVCLRHHYFKGRVIFPDGSDKSFVVWDGDIDGPPIELNEVEGLGDNVVCIQIDGGCDREFVEEWLSGMNGSGLILLTKNNAIYQATVETLARELAMPTKEGRA